MLHNKRPGEPQRRPYNVSTTTVARSHDHLPPISRPSALPRSTSGNSGPRLEALASSRPQPSQTSRPKPPSHHSRSVSEDVPLIFDTLRRSDEFRPVQNSSPLLRKTTATAHSAWGMESGTIFGIAVPEKRNPNRTPDLPPQLIPELQALASYHHKPHPLPPSSISTISSPSTRFTESPAPWSASTATTTPVSWPSSSPAFVQSAPSKSKTVPQPREPRSRLPKLPVIKQEQTTQKPPAVKESQSGSKPTGKSTRRKKSLLESPAPTPPPRTSSVKRSDGRSAANSIDETLSRAGLSTAPLSSRPEQSPLAVKARSDVDEIDSSLRSPKMNTAHANLQQSIKVMPARPSREGTTDLGQSRPTVINDHKAGFSNKHRRLLASAFEDATPHNMTKPSAQNKENTELKRSPSKLSKLSRLGMFTRRAANSSTSDLEKSPNKLQRRGPTAGTGHEGYGRYTKRGRKISSESSTRGSDSEQSVSSVKRTPFIDPHRKNSSTSSRKRSSQSDLDEFAGPRLKPVIMRGGSQSSDVRLDTSSQYGRSRENTPAMPQLDKFAIASNSLDSPRVSTLIRSPLRDVTNSRGNSPAMVDSVPRLALRRSQMFGPGHEGFRIPSPIRTGDPAAPLYITSKDTSLSSLPPSSAAPSITTHDLYRIDPSLLKPQEKRGRKQWWNPFRRRHQQPASIEPVYHPVAEPAEMAVTYATGPAPRSIPYYAVMESESENNTAEAIGDFLSQAIESPPPSPITRSVEVEEPAISRRTESILLPAAPVWSENAAPPSPSPSQTEDGSVQATDATVKQPRLAQVGRIPKVVNRHERQHVPSRRSFSQPFANKAAHEEGTYESDSFQDWHSDRPQLEIHTDVLPSRPFPEVEDISAKPASAPAQSAYAESRTLPYRTTDAPPFMPKHESDVSYSSSSDGVLSVMGPPIIPSQRERELRAQIPALRIASGLPGDDEIWKEYDDFLDHVMSPSKSKKSREPPLVIHPQPGAVPASSSPVIGGILKRSLKGKTPIIDPRKAVLDLSLPASLTPPVIFPSPSLLSERIVSDEIRLRRSRIVSALHSSIDPSSPFSMREFLRDYGAKGPDSAALTERFSTSIPAGYIAPITPTSGAFMEEPKLEHTHDENAHLLDSVERARDPARQSELHYASLEVARWLSFGRVLFSPAHEELHALPERNVLVIDGLGNEDWSIYCAVSYESEKAIIYDLKEDSNSGLSQISRDSAHTPANHHRRSVSSLSDRFPFHSAFFSAIVLRFPPVMPEAKLKSIITECRRVLVPGGHLEIMLLELDIVNMGVQTRRAVRELKMRMTDAAPDLDLKPTIDNFQTLLGGRGFTGLNRCVVGVPVTGRPTGSADSSSSSRSSRGSGNYPRRTSGGSSQMARSAHPAKGHNFSLNDLVADHSENADAKIGRMVSRTARSWWQHCYEADVMACGNQSASIFSDRRVMQECKARASSFKLLIAYAQRPVFESKRRTMSESGASTMATAGAQRRPRPAS